MPVRLPALIGSATGAGVVTLTEAAPVGSQLIVLSTWERIDLDPALPQLAHDEKGNNYRRDVHDAFTNAFPFRGDVDTSILGSIGVTAHVSQVTHALDIGDQITVPQGSNIAVLRTKGLLRTGAYFWFYGTSQWDGTVSPGSFNGQVAGLIYPFGLPEHPYPGPMTPGDLLIGLLGLGLPIEGAADPTYPSVTAGWTQHGAWTAHRPGEPSPHSLFVTSRKAGSAPTYDLQVDVGPDVQAVFNLFVLGYRHDPAADGSQLANLHTPHGAYLVADAITGRVRIKRSRFTSAPPWNFDDVFVGPTGGATPCLSYDPVREAVHLGYQAGGAITEQRSTNLGETWTEVTAVAELFPEGSTYYQIRHDVHGFCVRAAFTENDDGFGSILVSRQGPGEATPNTPTTLKDQEGVLLSWEPQGFGISPSDDAQDRWLFTGVLAGETEDSQWVSTDRLRTVKRIT